jgi:hypothetical protein
MARIVFKNHIVEFPETKDGVNTKSVEIPFEEVVLNPAVTLSGFQFEYKKKDKHIKEIVMKIENVSRTDHSVKFDATFGLRDGSGFFDDPYSGSMDVVIIAEVEEA